MTDLVGALAMVVPFSAAVLVSLLLTPVVRAVSSQVGLLAVPTHDRWHRRPVALLGGMAVWLTTLSVTIGLYGVSADTAAVVIVGTALFVIGLIDDVVQLKPVTKLNLEIVLACGVAAYGLHLHWTDSAAINALITVVWVVGITNGFNLLDNMDGLCAGVSVIAAIAFCATLGPADTAFIGYAAALGGATLGFLRFNFHPASIFLGDSGSLFLGSTFALLTLAREPSEQTGLISTIAVPVLILLLPIFDTTFVTVSRKLSARAASQGGRDHTSHRLVAIGFSERETTLLLYAVAAVSGAIAVGLNRANVESFGLGFLLIAALALLAIQLAQVRVYGENDFALLRNRPYTPLLIEVTYKRRVFEMILDTCLIGVAYYLAYALRFAEEFQPLYYDLFVRSLPIVIACQLVGFVVAGVYRGIWRYITIADLFTYARGILFGTFGMVLALVYLYRFTGYSRSVFILNAMLTAMLVVGSRLAFRWLGERARRVTDTMQPALVYGAGDGGALLVRELLNNPRHHYRPVGFLDDDPKKLRRAIMGIQVFGGLKEAESVIRKRRVAVVIVSTGKLLPDTLDALEAVCRRTGTGLRRMYFRIDEVGEKRLVSMA